jgi:hypothetical protein
LVDRKTWLLETKRFFSAYKANAPIKSGRLFKPSSACEGRFQYKQLKRYQ